MDNKVVQIGIPVTVENPSVSESKGVEVKASAPTTPVKEKQTVKVDKKRK